MNHRPAASAHLSAVALLLVTTCLLIASVADASSTAGPYSGRTSQHEPISLQISRGAVRRLRYRITDRCPGGRRLSVRAWGFPPLRIAHHRFGGTFVAKAPAEAKAVVAGTVSGAVIRGTLRDRTRSRTSHRICTGTARFTIRRRPPAPTEPAESLRIVRVSNTMPGANERPAGPKNTSKLRRSWIPEER